jgi:hypothetical protein
MTWDKIINGLVEIQSAIKEKLGDDGTVQQPDSGRLYKDGPGGFDRIQYEIEEIAEKIRHISAPITPEPPAEGVYELQSVDGVIQWVEVEAES